jgi:hypothetical protein
MAIRRIPSCAQWLRLGEYYLIHNPRSAWKTENEENGSENETKTVKEVGALVLPNSLTDPALDPAQRWFLIERRLRQLIRDEESFS